MEFVEITESGRRDFPVHVLDRLSGGVDFTWNWIPPRGTSGDILLGIKTTSLELLEFSCGEFHTKLHLQNKSDNFIWSLIAVYDAAKGEHKAAFLR